MRSRLYSQILFLFILLSPAQVRANPDAMIDQVKEVFTWFDSLSLPKISKAPFVRIYTGSHYMTGKQQIITTTFPGFILAEDKQRFSVLYADLSQRTLERKGPQSDPTHESVTFKPMPFRTYVLDFLSPPKSEGSLRWEDPFSSRPKLEGIGRYLALAWLAHLRQEKTLRDEILLKSDVRSYPKTASGITIPLLTAVQLDFRKRDLWNARLLFEDSTKTRLEILDQYRAILQKYRGVPGYKHVADKVEMLEQMVREDEAYEEQQRKGAGESKEDRLKRLVFLLRDQVGLGAVTDRDPAMCISQWFFENDQPTSPAELLIESGVDAVPYLIEALDDRRLTRENGVTVGQCAEEILFRISRKINKPLTVYISEFPKGQWCVGDWCKEKETARQELIRQWWKQIKAQ